MILICLLQLQLLLSFSLIRDHLPVNFNIVSCQLSVVSCLTRVLHAVYFFEPRYLS